MSNRSVWTGWCGLCVVALCLVAAARPASAQAVGPVAQQQQGVVALEEPRSWHVGGALTTRVGQGSFVALERDSGVPDDGSAYARVMLAASLWGAWAPHDAVTLTASGALTQWLTQGGGMNAPYETRLQDVQLGAIWSGESLGPAGLHVSGGAGLGLPTSAVSQTATMLLDASVWAQLSARPLKPLWLGLTSSGGKTFHQYTSPVIEADEVGAGNALYRAGGAEDLGGGLVALDGINTEYTWSNALAARVAVWGPLSAQVSYTLMSFWTYDVPREDGVQSSPLARSGRGFGQLSSGLIAVRADLMPELALTVGANTVMAPLSDDNKRVRFPLWDLSGAARNQTQLFLSVSGTY